MRYLKPLPTLKSTDIERFWLKVIRKGPDDCWIWIGGQRTYKCPSPNFSIGQQDFIASRVAYAIEHGSVDPDKYVLHNCPTVANPNCMNPEHLYLGDQYDNMQDRFAERPDDHCSDHLFDKAEEIYIKWEAGASMRDLAIQYGTNYPRIRLVIKKHYPNALESKESYYVRKGPAPTKGKWTNTQQKSYSDVSEETKQVILISYYCGIKIDEIVRKFKMGSTSIRRIVNS